MNAGTDSRSGAERRGQPSPGDRRSDGRDDRSTRYRYLIGVVGQLDRTVTIDQLADVMVQWEPGDGASKSWHDIHEELYVVDLPTLDQAGILEFDADAGTVEADGRR